MRNSLLDVRDALHEASGRKWRRLDAELIPEVAELLGMGAEELDLHTRQLGRRIAHLSSLAWRRIDRAVAAPTRKPKISPTGPVVDRLAEGVGLLDGEVIVMQRADPGD